MQFLHPGLEAIFSPSPEGNPCTLACMRFLHPGRSAKLARWPAGKFRTQAAGMQKMHLICVQILPDS